MLMTVPELIAQVKEEVRALEAAVALPECKEKGGILIDVREPAEVQAKASKGAINIPRGMLEMMALEKIKNSDQPIYIHCASGVRAILAAEQLGRVGYEDVTVISCPVDVVCAVQEAE